MTKLEKQMAETLLQELEGLNIQQAVEHLFGRRLVNLRSCEQLAAHNEIERLEHHGMLRCEAMHATAQQFCCSYEKIRNYYYNSYKS